MKSNSKILGRFLTAALIAGASLAGASTKTPPNVPQTDEQIARNAIHEIRTYSNYSIWDDVSLRVNNGQVELLGAVSQPYKKSDIEHMIQRVPGVVSVNDSIKVLPLSPNDDRLRLQVARALFSDPNLGRYAMGAIPSIHIIVDNGHVTLTGVVMTDMDKTIAGMRASGAGLSFGTVDNQLQVTSPKKRS